MVVSTTYVNCFRVFLKQTASCLFQCLFIAPVDIELVIHDDVIKWKHFRVTGPLCGEFTVHRCAIWYMRLKHRLSKQSWGWWFETPSCPLWRHCNARFTIRYNFIIFTSKKQNHLVHKYLVNMYRLSNIPAYDQLVERFSVNIKVVLNIHEMLLRNKIT